MSCLSRLISSINFNLLYGWQCLFNRNTQSPQNMTMCTAAPCSHTEFWPKSTRSAGLLPSKSFVSYLTLICSVFTRRDRIESRYSAFSSGWIRDFFLLGVEEGKKHYFVGWNLLHLGIYFSLQFATDADTTSNNTCIQSKKEKIQMLLFACVKKATKSIQMAGFDSWWRFKSCSVFSKQSEF